MSRRQREAALSDEDLAAAVTGALDDSVRAYDAATRHRLRAAREAALREAARRDSLVLAGRWLGLGAALASCAMFWVLWSGPMQTPVADPPEPELLAMAAETELYRDLDFYQWLPEVESSG